MTYTVAAYIIETLKLLGVKRIYGIIGTSILDFIDALYDYRSDIRFVTTRHEQVAVSMADAEYRAACNLGVAAVHGGPGFLNTLISLGIAFKDKIPLFLLTGGVPRRLRGTDAMHEVDQVSLARPVAKCAVRLSSSIEVPEAIIKLLRACFSKPRGPVVLEVSEDLWSEEVHADPKEVAPSSIAPKPQAPSVEDLEEILECLIKAEKPAILACGEVALPGVEVILGELAERLGAYVITTGNGRGACDEASPRSIGRVGFGGGSIPADRAFEEADVLLVLGDELDDIVTYRYNILPKGKVLVVTENKAVMNRPINYAKIVYADPYETVKALLELARSRDVRLRKPLWDEAVGKHLAEWNLLIEEALSRKYDKYVNPSKFFKKLYEALPVKHIIVGGQGVHVLYVYDFIKIRRARTFLASTNMGAMGYAFPAALGAKLALPDHEVIAVVGDGEFMMTIQDLETAVREYIPVKVIVVNDMAYRVLLLRQMVQKGGRVMGTVLQNPSFEELARAFKADGITVDSDDKIDYAIREMLKSDKPYVVDLIISQEDIPPFNFRSSTLMR